MSYKRSEKTVLKPMTIRFSEEAWTQFDAEAKKLGMNKTEFIRMTVTKNLYRYMGTIRIIDEELAAEIKDLLRALLDEVSAVRMELRRIGINYNQAVRLKHIERKYANLGKDINTLLQRHDEEERVKSECKEFSQNEIDTLMARYEKATSKVGELLCRILI